MPLCPQITNTPITVTQTVDFTVTSVVPAIANTSDGLADEFASIETMVNGKNKIYRQTTAPTGTLTIGDIWFDTDDGNKLYYWTGTAWVSVQDNAIATAQATADSKIKTFYQASAPTATEVGDIWFDTDDGFKQYYWDGTSWLSVQDTAIAAATSAATAASAAATAAQTTADGKNKVFRQTSPPTASAIGDLWFDTDDDNRIYRWDGSSWVANSLGNNALVSISASKLTAGTIDASVITVSNINAGNISTGTLSADRIAAASITGTKIAAGTITASNITAGTITASQIAASTITGSLIAAATITASNIAANTITASQIAAGTITATQISSSYVYAGTINANQINAGTLTGFLIQTSSSTTAVTLDGSTNSMYFKYLGTVYGHILPASSGSVMIHYGATATPGGSAYPQFYVGGSAVYMAQSSTRYALIDSSGLAVSGDIALSVGAFWTGTFSSSSTDTTAGTYISQSGAIIARRNNQIAFFANRYNATGTAEMIRLVYNGADAGGIQTSSAGSPSFRTTSDYRLKNNIQDYTGASNIIKSLRVRSYEMNNNPGKTEIGFIAHEYAETVPDMVNGVKDGIDADGNPEYQSISTTNLIPYIVGALKEALLRIETLEGGNK